MSRSAPFFERHGGTALAYRWSRRLESYAFAASPEQLGIQEGLRAATAVAVLVAFALWLHRPILSWGAFGAFWVCLADPGGPDRVRWQAMGGFAFAGTLTAWLAASAAGMGVVWGGAILLPLVFLASLGGWLGPAIAQVGTLVSVVAVVAAAFPSAPRDALAIGGVFLLGCVWALLLCIVIWRIHPHAPARRALAWVFDRLGDMATQVLTLDAQGADASAWQAFNGEQRRAVRTAIERTRRIINGLQSEQAHYRAQLTAAERVLASLIAIGHALGEQPHALDARGERVPMGRLILLIGQARRLVAQREPVVGDLLDHALATADDTSAVTVTGRAVRYAAQVLASLARHANDVAEPAPTAEASPIATTSSRRLLRHAARMAVAVVVTYTIAAQWDLAYSYWATMATVVVLQPLAAITWPRSIERMLGSIAGGLFAAALTIALPGPLDFLLVIFPLAAATIALRLVNYTLFVFFLTPLFVLVSELLQPGAGLASTRAIDNVIGSLVGLATAFLLWPEHDVRHATDGVAEAVRANLRYAAQVVGSPLDSPALDEHRRQAGIASGEAETRRHRMILEGQRRRARLDAMGDLLEALRVLAGAATTASISAPPRDPARMARLQTLADALAHAITTQTPIETDHAGDKDELGAAIDAVIARTERYVQAPSCVRSEAGAS